MEYQKKYPIPKLKNEFLLIGWDRGYKNIQLFYKDRLIETIQNASQLKKGLTIQDSELNRIDLKFSDTPMAIDVVFDGIHCASNVSHPFKEMKKFGSVFWMIAIFGLCFSAFELAVNYKYSNAYLIVLAIDLPIVIAYFISALFVSKSKPWAFWLGFTSYSFAFLITVFSIILELNSILFGINFIIRLIFMIFMIRMVKTVLNVSKHKNYLNNSGEDLDLLDN
jgi:hypothetical protein